MARASSKRSTTLKASRNDFVMTLSDSDNDAVRNKYEDDSDKEEERQVELDPDFAFGDKDTAVIHEAGWSLAGAHVANTTTANDHVDIDKLIATRVSSADHLPLSQDPAMGDSEDSEGQDDPDEMHEDSHDSSEELNVEENLASEEDHETDTEETQQELEAFYDTSTENTIHQTFATLSLSRPILRGISALNYTKPTAVQSQVIPIALMGKDVVAGAETGSGKTAAFLVPILERLLYRSRKAPATRVLVLSPTRELAVQVSDMGKRLAQYVPDVSFGLAVGGFNLRAQEQALKSKPDIVVATPGRLIDHVRNSASFQIDSVEILVVDEADRMLEEGFQRELTEVLKMLPEKRQTLLFSATMNSSIKDLVKLSLQRPVRIMVNTAKKTAGGLTQEFIRLKSKSDSCSPAVLATLLQNTTQQQRVIVFVARKETAHRVRVILGLLGRQCGELHGNLSQDLRSLAVENFRSLKVPVLICTDLAARGLDIPKIELVINYDMPASYQVYVHRVGRTARAGRKGTSISLVKNSKADRAIVRQALKALRNEGKQSESQILTREVDWAKVDEIQKIVDSKSSVVEDILREEKNEKYLREAERDLQKSENLINHEDEIKSRPKRTWFMTDAEKKLETKSVKKRKQNLVTKEKAVVLRKTRAIRSLNKKRGFRPEIKSRKPRKAR